MEAVAAARTLAFTRVPVELQDPSLDFCLLDKLVYGCCQVRLLPLSLNIPIRRDGLSG